MNTSKIKSGYVAVNNTQLYYEITGAANPETLVMIHAGICDHRMWQSQVEYFAGRFRIITFDLRGFGNSTMVKGAFAHYEDVHALLVALEVEKAWLMGCSLGGRIALDIALTYPERVRGLILVGAAIGGYRYDGPPHPKYDEINAAYDSGDMVLTSELEVQLWVDGEGRSSDQVDSQIRDLVREMNLIALRVDEALWEQETELDPPAIERLERISHPALIVIGDLDLAPSKDRSAILEKRLPNATKITLADTAHVPNMERPQQFNDIVVEFLNKNR